ncbi:MAG: DNRLRE domain-containing protein [Oscillospiraceae bacterium]|nr:DNRLRE domain-containing protein [Oscillospiraceae bacterium]
MIISISRRMRVCLLAGCLLAFCQGCAPASDAWTSQDAAAIVCAWISEAEPTENMGMNYDPGVLHAGKTAAGERVIGLIRFDLPADVLPEEVTSARLRLLPTGETAAPSALLVGAVEKEWDSAWVNYAEHSAYLPEGTSTPVAVENGEWVLDVTDIAKAWLAASVPNAGLALSAPEGGTEYAFWSSYAENPDNTPKLEIQYIKGERALDKGAYGFAEAIDGNCLSYALRDTAGIYIDDLAVDEAAFAQAYRDGGENAAMDVFKGYVAAYVEANKEALRITSFREIEGYDAPIDPAKEYRIALRIGFRDAGGEFGVIDIPDDFDYHLQAELNDGTWSEKVPQDAARIVPGSHLGLDQGLVQWNTSYQWGNDKWNNYYTSDAVYYAVTKEGAGLTGHR